MNRIIAPWTDDQVTSLNAFQADGRMHEFTCNWGHHCLVRSLTATKDGWVCKGCPYKQAWAYDWMCNWEWKGMLEKIHGGLHES